MASSIASILNPSPRQVDVPNASVNIHKQFSGPINSEKLEIRDQSGAAGRGMFNSDHLFWLPLMILFILIFLTDISETDG